MTMIGRPLAGSTSLTTTAAAALTTTTACRSVAVQNDPNNTVDVLVGDADSQTFQLQPGDSIVLPVSDLAFVYAKNVSSTTQSINWLAVR
jgi:hypothetical protein